MNTTARQNITSDEALGLINSGEALIDKNISGVVRLDGKDNFNKTLIADNCRFEHLSGISSQFSKVVRLINSEFSKCDFTFSYFLGGLEIENCIFDNYLDFQAGGHNKNGNAVLIKNCLFKNFVNFFDCWYESVVIIKNNDFQKGTNLLGVQTTSGIKTTFDVTPIIKDNLGKLDIDSEGDIESKAIYLR